jgi:hypothetical protein
MTSRLCTFKVSLFCKRPQTNCAQYANSVSFLCCRIVATNDPTRTPSTFKFCMIPLFCIFSRWRLFSYTSAVSSLGVFVCLDEMWLRNRRAGRLSQSPQEEAHNASCLGSSCLATTVHENNKEASSGYGPSERTTMSMEDR